MGGKGNGRFGGLDTLRGFFELWERQAVQELAVEDWRTVEN